MLDDVDPVLPRPYSRFTSILDTRGSVIKSRLNFLGSVHIKISHIFTRCLRLSLMTVWMWNCFSLKNVDHVLFIYQLPLQMSSLGLSPT